MASIFGFQLKGIKKFLGREWEGVQGDIYLNGKKVGFFNDDGNGGGADIDFYLEKAERQKVEQTLQNAIVDYLKRFPLDGWRKELDKFDDECFFTELLDLVEFEKIYKKESKKGRPFLVVYEKSDTHLTEYMATVSKEIYEMKKKSNGIEHVRAYKSLDDFVISAA